MAAGRREKGGAGPVTLAGAYVGSVIGAGFASGQEHATFFLRFGREGLWGLGLAGLMFMVFGALLLNVAHRHQTRSHTELLNAIAAPPVATLFDIILSFFVLTSLSVMMAGSGALLHTLTGAPASVGVFGMAAATLGMLLLQIDRMLQLNAALTAVLITVILWVGIASLSHVNLAGLAEVAVDESWVPDSWLFAAALYGSYNLALTLTLFGSLGSEIEDVKAPVLAGAGGGLLLFLVSLGVCLAVASSLPFAAAEEIPVLLAAKRLGTAVHSVYTCAIGLAMLTTAVASAYTLTQRLGQLTGCSHGLRAFVVVGAGVPLATLGFGRLVGTLYPLIGYVGAGCLALAAFSGFRLQSRRRV